MKRPKNRVRKNPPSARAAAPPSWWTDKRPLWHFGLKFGAVTLLLTAFFSETAWGQRALAAAVTAQVSLSDALLNRLGETCHVSGATLSSGRGAIITVSAGCSGVEVFCGFCAALLAFPAPWRRKLAGLMLGCAVLAVLNWLRIVSLYYFGVHHFALLPALHTEVWPILLNLATLLLALAWVLWARREETLEGHAAA